LSGWSIPGPAVAVINEDRVILLGGCGVREAGRPEKVGVRTLFGVGSATKSFTAAANVSVCWRHGLTTPAVTRLVEIARKTASVQKNLAARADSKDIMPG
jgi:hypothetical protein